MVLLGAVGPLLLVACANVALPDADARPRSRRTRGGTAGPRRLGGASGPRVPHGVGAARPRRRRAGRGPRGRPPLRVLPAIAPDLPRVEEVSARPARALGLRGRCHDTLGTPVWPAPGVAPGPSGPGRRPSPRRRNGPIGGGRPSAARRHGGGAGRAGRGAAGGIGLLVRSVRALGATRSRVRSARRPGRPGVPRQPGLQQRRSAPAPTTVRCSSAWPPCRAWSPSAAPRRCRPARSGPTSNGRCGPRAPSPMPPRCTPASVRMVTPGYFSALGLRLADGRAVRRPRCTDRPARRHGERIAGPPPVARPSRRSAGSWSWTTAPEARTPTRSSASSATCASGARAASPVRRSTCPTHSGRP